MVYYVIGLMSGTSLDGLDIAACKFARKEENLDVIWNFEILHAITIEYDENLKNKLKNAHILSAYDYVCLNNELGNFFGDSVKQFLENLKTNNSELANIKFDFVASHGHTVFHEPSLNLTTQIGNGAIVAARCNLPVICDFRTTDVALNGQGAPLVPIGDKLLFAKYNFCLNLGGIANISTQINEKRIAFDICHANMVLNNLANRLGFDYDNGGEFARKGNFEHTRKIFEQLNELEFYQQSFPKSLGREYFTDIILPIIENYINTNVTKNTKQEIDSIQNIYDLLACFTHHIAYQIANFAQFGDIFITGGGAFNVFLIELLQSYAPNLNIIISDKQITAFKEALIFAFLGVLRWRNEENTLQTVTGATKNSCGGCVYIG